ncbi:MAG: hypothetical protein LBJ46_06645 [Planctomycetota bacterium]|jgi:hypothetical protein|nr:hypothetical protein [Planctomycetota bacterium]
MSAISLADAFGSDYHGKTEPAIAVGGHGGEAYENEALEFVRGLAGQSRI